MTEQVKQTFRLRFGLRLLLGLITLIAIGLFGYQQWIAYRDLSNARQWVRSLDGVGVDSNINPFVVTPPVIADGQHIATLVTGALKLETLKDKICCLKILGECYPQDCLDALVKIATRSKDPEVQRIAVHVITLRRDVDTLSRIDKLAKSPDPKLRAARLDCIGFTRLPTYSDALAASYSAWDGKVGKIDCSPPVRTAEVFTGSIDGRGPFFSNQAKRDFAYALRENFPEHYRLELERVILADDSSPEERAAASRAIVVWPPTDYQLRYAEWGVWINSEGQFHLVDSIIEEIPEFVHRTSNEVESFAERMSIPMIVTKPVIHLTSSKPMAIDLEVAFNYGRPWFAYPRPDDFNLLYHPWGAGNPIAPFDQNKAEPMEVREGYPWMLPLHRQQYSNHSDARGIYGLGVRWQSAIVSPTKLPWMKLPKVEAGPKYTWWKDLRDVQCSWVSNLNESERFIYYDGPTLANSPVNLAYEADLVQVSNQKIFDDEKRTRLVEIARGQEKTKEPVDPVRHGFFIRVTESGPSGTAIQLEDGQELDLEQIKLSDAAELRKIMLDRLIESGLNHQEASGLLKCWTPAFFEEPGQRIVFLLHQNEYDLMCPMTIRPQPTELARVGLVLTELLD